MDEGNTYHQAWYDLHIRCLNRSAQFLSCNRKSIDTIDDNDNSKSKMDRKISVVNDQSCLIAINYLRQSEFERCAFSIVKSEISSSSSSNSNLTNPFKQQHNHQQQHQQQHDNIGIRTSTSSMVGDIDIPFSCEPILMRLSQKISNTTSLIKMISLTKVASLKIFIWGYAVYLAGEKKKEEEIREARDQASKAHAKNPYLPALERALSHVLFSNKITTRASDYTIDRDNYLYQLQNDGFLLYLYGIILKATGIDDIRARYILCLSIARFPLNWSAWLDLVSLCPNREVFEQLDVPTDHWIYAHFRAHALNEFQQHQDAVEASLICYEQFPSSTWAIAQVALAQYSIRNYDQAKKMFEALSKLDPLRLENTDTYSNILYVERESERLSLLAQRAVQADRFRPETCCIIANYYSVKSLHEKSIEYFKRAIKMNRRYLEAWTLIGHEFHEIGNHFAAIESYRTAIDVNNRDYRAWYGLGQAYGAIKLFNYASHYYRKAISLRPYDPALWCKFGQHFILGSEVGPRYEEAISCFKNAEKLSPNFSNTALISLARIYKDIGDIDNAITYFSKVINNSSQFGGQASNDEVREAAGFLKSIDPNFSF